MPLSTFWQKRHAEQPREDPDDEVIETQLDRILSVERIYETFIEQFKLQFPAASNLDLAKQVKATYDLLKGKLGGNW